MDNPINCKDIIMHCYNCGKEIDDTSKAISLDDLNWTHTECLSNPGNKPLNPIPKYMFENKPITPTTYIDLMTASLDTFMLADRTALLVDPVTREYCYVFWDEADQPSNPYPTQDEALSAVFVYKP